MTANRFSLQSKIILIISATVILVVGVSTVIAMFMTREPVEEEIYRKALAQARLTTHQLVTHDGLQSPEALVRALRQMEHDIPGVIQSDVYTHTPDHRLIVSTRPDSSHLELDNIPKVEDYNEYFKANDEQISIETADGKFWIIGTVVPVQGQAVGCLDLKVSKSRLNVVTLDLVRRNLTLLLASLAVVLLVVHVFFMRAVRRPVKEMIRVMEAGERGQLQVRARVKSGDEIGLLAAHLNRMLVRIQNFNSELGRKVEFATAELARRNEELRRINEELFETQKTLARSERLAVAGQLAASLAHEIGTPLNSISGHVQLLARRKTTDQDTARRLQIIEKQIESIVRTVKQLLSWSRKFDLRIEPTDLRRVLEEAALLSSPVLQLRKIQVKMDLPRECPKIYGDAGYLQQVFLNLINNSMDAMARGGQLRVALRPPSNTAPEGVVVEVADNGPGMSRETLAHIFDPMFTTKRIGTGAGLGLAICDQIVRQHGGSIHVESEPGVGTCFYITLPLDCREKVEATATPAGVATTDGTAS